LAKPSQLADLEATVLRLPAIVCPLANAVLAADVADLLPGPDQFEDADDLSFGELTLAHDVPPEIDPFIGSLS